MPAFDPLTILKHYGMEALVDSWDRREYLITLRKLHRVVISIRGMNARHFHSFTVYHLYDAISKNRSALLRSDKEISLIVIYDVKELLAEIINGYRFRGRIKASTNCKFLITEIENEIRALSSHQLQLNLEGAE